MWWQLTFLFVLLLVNVSFLSYNFLRGFIHYRLHEHVITKKIKYSEKSTNQFGDNYTNEWEDKNIKNLPTNDFAYVCKT